jgi:hypothetical protein
VTVGDVLALAIIGLGTAQTFAKLIWWSVS